MEENINNSELNENLTETDAEDTVEETTEEKAPERISAKEYKEVQDMLDQLRDMMEEYKEMVNSTVTNDYGLSTDIVNPEGGILGYTNTDIAAMSVDDMKEILTKYGSEENTADMYESNIQEEGETEEVVYRRIVMELKKMQLGLIENQQTYKEGVAQTLQIGDEYRNFLSSNAYKEKRDKMMENLRAEATNEKDELKKAKMLRKIKLFDDTVNLDFFKKRLVEHTDKEVKAIVRGFFNEREGTTMITKYGSRITKFGFEKDLYSKFFNIEERFLPEEYHVFNNLFLYMYMRFVSFADPYFERDKAYVKAITANIASLIYHRFNNEQAKTEFVDFIKSCLDYFADYREKFDENNTTHPNHKDQIAKREKHESQRKELILKRFEELGITDIPDPETSSSDELYECLESRITSLQEQQLKEHQEEESSDDEEKETITVNTTEHVDEDGSYTHVAIEPKMTTESTDSPEDDMTVSVEE